MRLRLFIAAVTLGAIATPAIAGAFIGGNVNTASVSPPGSPLQVRAQPKASALSLGFILDGDPISLTGACKQFGPAGQLLKNFNIKTLTAAKANAKIHGPRIWCHTLFEPTPGNPVAGWVNAKFVDLN